MTLAAHEARVTTATIEIRTPTNPFEARWRARKVARLTLMLERFGLGDLTAAEWMAVAVLAGVRPPSPTTIAQVRHILAARAQRRPA
ncbi:MAG: hypothetical protein ACRDZ3_19980 [Acidimicrobiia bacterium]